MILVAGKKIILNDEGYLIDRSSWTPEIANALAKSINIELTEEHWQVINFLRQFYQSYHVIPPLRVFIKNLKETLGAELGNSLKLHQLFPESPLKFACLIGGLPKPKHCM